MSSFKVIDKIKTKFPKTVRQTVEFSFSSEKELEPVIKHLRDYPIVNGKYFCLELANYLEKL